MAQRCGTSVALEVACTRLLRHELRRRKRGEVRSAAAAADSDRAGAATEVAPTSVRRAAAAGLFATHVCGMAVTPHVLAVVGACSADCGRCKARLGGDCGLPRRRRRTRECVARAASFYFQLTIFNQEG